MQINDEGTLFQVGLGLAIVGAIFIAITLIILFGRRTKKGKVQVAGAVIVGPVPIIFGSNKKSVKTVLELSIVLTVLLIVLTLIYYFLLR